MESATGARARRKIATAARVTSLARELTAERGLSGFTVEELCDAADIARRTFFNYFASKDDAVLGFTTQRETGADDEFLTAHGPQGDGTPRPAPHALLDDLAALTVRRWTRADITVEHVHEIRAAVEREPRLLTRLQQRFLEARNSDVELVERREELPSGHPRASVAVDLVGALAEIAAHQFISPGNTDTFAELLTSRLAVARELFTASHDTERTT